MFREPLLVPVLALATGILAGNFVYFRLPELALPLAAATLLLALAVYWPPAFRLRLTCVAYWFAWLGLATQVYHRQDHVPTLNTADGETVLLTGCIVDPPVFAPDKSQFTLQLAPDAFAHVSVVLKDNAALHLTYGQSVEMAAKVRIPHDFQNPGDFDYASWLASRHIYWTAWVRTPEEIRVLPGRCGHRALGWMFSIRTWALGRLERLYANDSRTALLLKATLLGQTVGVQRRWTNDFRITGTYHALVISGLHVSVLALTLLFLLRLVNLGRIPAFAIGSVAAWLYAFLSGLNPPAVRAAAGFSLFLLASFLFRRARIVNILAVVALAYLLFQPGQLFDASFQLSFLAVAALALFAIPAIERYTEPLRLAAQSPQRVHLSPKLDPRAATLRVELRLAAETLRVWTRLPPRPALYLVSTTARIAVFAAEAVIITACIQFGLALPLAVYFHRIPLTGLSANVLVVPLLSIVVPTGFAAIFTGWHWLAAFTALCLHWAEAIAAWHGHFEPGWRIAALPLWMTLAFTASLIALALSIRHRRRLAPLVAATSIALFALIWIQPWKPNLRPGWLEVSAIDVSQGDSIFVAFPNGQTLLIDGGGVPGMGRLTRTSNIDMGEDVVSPYLWSRRIRRLDYVALTHGHSDHMDGLSAVLDNFRPRELWISVEPDSPGWESLRAHAQRDGVRIRRFNSASPSFRIGGTTLSVLAPPPDYVPAATAGNNDSLVLQIDYGRRRALLTGDAERPIEDEMLSAGRLELVTVLKVGHHGSKTSTSEEFLDSVRPEFALISDGYLNQFHHPHPSVLARLAAHHTLVLRTDDNGLLTFRTDGNRVELTPYR